MAVIRKEAILGLIVIIMSLSFSFYASALPAQPVITAISNETSANSGIGQARSGDDGGYIITLSLNTTQQNYRWKAYVGNVTGTLVLEDASGYNIYGWDMMLNAVGNVFISRNGTVDWTDINCSNQSLKASEDAFLNIPSSQGNSINQTFHNQTHKSFKVSGTTYPASTCYAIATYINDTAQTLNESSKFQEVLLKDGSSNMVYMTMMEQNAQGFDNGQYDFQAIIAEDETAPTPTTYYFYVELEG